MKFHIAALAPFIALGFTAGIAHAKDPALLSLTLEHFRDTASVTDDPVGGVTTISTEKGFAEHRGPMRTVWNDEYLTGVIDKKTGQRSFQVHAWITYKGNWRFYETANYQAIAGAKSVPAAQTGKEMENCAAGDCMYTERLAFPVDEELLRQLAAASAPGKPAIWAYKFTSKSGPDFTGGLSSAEIAGFLAKLDELNNTVPAAKANAVSASLKRDLGIGGMPVAATAELPNRGGILVFGVNSGSIAQKSGIIVGDILYEFDGHPVKALAELEAAVAACAGKSAVAIKLYRGTDVMAVTARF
jgi:membrane-associated protease RseP (regulator of RpoE activity)